MPVVVGRLLRHVAHGAVDCSGRRSAPQHLDGSLIGRDLSQDEPDDRGLPRPVWADECAELAGGERKACPFENGGAAIRKADVVKLNCRLHYESAFTSLSRLDSMTEK